MTGIPFSQVLKNAHVDIRKEYDRLYQMFYILKNQKGITLRMCCAIFFMQRPFRGTCISLDDFDNTYGYYFEKSPENFDIKYLISFCQYSYNLANFEYKNVDS